MATTPSYDFTAQVVRQPHFYVFLAGLICTGLERNSVFGPGSLGERLLGTAMYVLLGLGYYVGASWSMSRQPWNSEQRAAQRAAMGLPPLITPAMLAAPELARWPIMPPAPDTQHAAALVAASVAASVTAAVKAAAAVVAAPVPITPTVLLPSEEPMAPT